MSDAPSEVDRAQAEVTAARERLSATLGEIQHRISPRNVLHEVWSGLRERGSRAAGGAVALVRRRPGTTAGTVAAIGLLLLRRPLSRGAATLFSDKGETEGRSGKLKAADAQRAAPRPRRRRAASDKGD